MIGDVAFDLKRSEPTPGPGMYVVKPYLAVRGSQPIARVFGMGSRETDLTQLGTLTGEVMRRLQQTERNRLIGYSILKLREVKHELLAERVGTYALAMPGAPQLPVSRLLQMDHNGVCRAQYAIEGAGVALNSVDFPTTRSERERPGNLAIVEAAVSSHLGRANIVVRPHVHLMTARELAQ